jgi:hypothetical protein
VGCWLGFGASRYLGSDRVAAVLSTGAPARWAFYQLRVYIEYKAKEAGVKMIFIVPYLHF